MSEPFTFVVRHRAAPQGSKTLDKGKRGKPFMRESSAGVRPFRTAVRRAAADETGRPRAQFTGPVLVGIVFEFEQAKSNTDDYPTGQNIGDLDKLTRAVLDGLTEAQVIEDDRFVVGWLHGDKPTKLWGPEDRVIITVRSAALGPPRDLSVVDFGPVPSGILLPVTLSPEQEAEMEKLIASWPQRARNPFDSYGPCVGCGEGDDGNHSDGECVR